MSFKMKYTIEKKYLTPGTKRRPDIPMNSVEFLVAHDTGNDGSTALNNIGWYERTNNDQSASAHTFIDHTGIYECIPFTTDDPEKAWHVRYNRPEDNEMYGDDANDVAGGVELCYSGYRGSINNEESYKRYVWYLAYSCYKFNLNPAKDIIGHEHLDPGRKTDPTNALRHMGKTFDMLVEDVIAEYSECTKQVEEVRTMKLADWQFDMLAKAYKYLHEEAKILTSDRWWKKAQARELTVDENSFLNTVVQARRIAEERGEDW